MPPKPKQFVVKEIIEEACAHGKVCFADSWLGRICQESNTSPFPHPQDIADTENSWADLLYKKPNLVLEKVEKLDSAY